MQATTPILLTPSNNEGLEPSYTPTNFQRGDILTFTKSGLSVHRQGLTLNIQFTEFNSGQIKTKDTIPLRELVPGILPQHVVELVCFGTQMSFEETPDSASHQKMFVLM